MKRPAYQSRARQRGVVAILVGLMMAVGVFTGMLALVIDLGQLYIAKTELQNAADSAALAGASELNNTTAGIDRAVAEAIAAAGENFIRFSQAPGPVAVSAGNIQFAPAPTGPWSSVAGARARPDGLSFIKVDTTGNPQGTLDAYFAFATTTTTFGLAVAGPYVIPITPLGVCAINTTPKASGPNGELLEFGFRRGIDYNIPSLNPLAGLSADPMWVNPVDTVTCDPNHSSTNFMEPFVCVGKSSAIVASTGSQRVFINTGASAGLERALNSRFNIFTGNTCDPVTAPRDKNITPYAFNDPNTWMSPAQTRQDARFDQATRAIAPTTTGEYGVLWSYHPAVRYDGSSVTGAGTKFLPSDWPTLYSPPALNVPNANYPTDGSTPYIRDIAPGAPGKIDRRVLNVVLIDCDLGVIGGSGACSEMRLLGVGRFFMQVPADLSASPRTIFGEFAGIIPRDQLRRTVRLYE